MVQRFEVHARWSRSANCWIAICDEIGLAVESASWDGLRRQVLDAAAKLESVPGGAVIRICAEQVVEIPPTRSPEAA